MDLSLMQKAGITFVSAGIIFVFGLVILNSIYTNTTYTDKTITSEAIVIPLTNATQNGTVTLAHGNLTSFTDIKNLTGTTLTAANYSVALSTGVITFVWINNVSGQLCQNGTTCYATYEYREYQTPAGAAVDNTMSAVAELPNNWFTLIAVVIAGILVLSIVLYGMGKMGNRR